MGFAMHLAATVHNALILHLIAAPLIFVAVSFLYFRRPSSLSPLYAAMVFVMTVAVFDLFVVALLIERSFAMFGSILGVWLPFVLIFLVSWATGWTLRRELSRRTRPTSAA
jgi:hypothetical protein